MQMLILFYSCLLNAVKYTCELSHASCEIQISRGTLLPWCVTRPLAAQGFSFPASSLPREVHFTPLDIVHEYWSTRSFGILLEVDVQLQICAMLFCLLQLPVHKTAPQ